MKYAKLYKEIDDFYNNKDRIVRDPFKTLLPEFIVQLTEDMKNIELIRDSNNKVDTLKTLQNIDDPELAAAAKIAYTAKRSDLLAVKKATLNPEYASLTPLLMYAHKKYNNVPYNDWKRDKNIIYAMTGFLYRSLVKTATPKFKIDNIGEQRIKSLSSTANLHSYQTRLIEVKIDDTYYKVYGSTPANHMLLQTWLANADFRVPGAMILDPWDWDRVPKAYDIVTTASKQELPW